MNGAKEVIEKIREELFGIGIDHSGLPENVKNYILRNNEFKRDAAKLAEDIHTKKPHFIFELIQNAEDNEYDMNVIPKIKFILTSNCLIVQNNEIGFNEENVWAMCKIGGSTKTNKYLGYIGEKGIGFKSVFMVADEVQVFSNGFQFRFKYDKNDPLTMLIPEWTEHTHNFVDPSQTNIVLVLNDESKASASRYLDDAHLNLLLFLQKLKIIEIEDRTKGIYRKFERLEKDNMVEIKIKEKMDKSNKTSVLRWFVVKKLLTVPLKISEDKRKGIKETEILLAFPLKEDGSPNASKEQYVFAFLPVRKYGFKFIIQADFILSINREDIIKDKVWNRWLRDSIVDVFVDAVDRFKRDDKLKHYFYEYLPFDEVKDEFFLSVVDKIYEKLKAMECILTESNTWRKPSEILIGDKGIKKIIPNKDLYNFLGKEYLSDKIKVKKQVLRDKLGIGEFLIDDLIEILGNTEWLKKHEHNDEWFAELYRYLSNKKLSEEQLGNLRNLNIIRLENGELTSINKDTVFFPLKRERTYGFESEIRIIRRDIISKYGKGERDKIFEFLKKLGIRYATPYEIIENYILPIYENGTWKEKDSGILIGHVIYIKDYLNEYSEESDRRLNGNRRWRKSKEDPLNRLKKSLLIRITKNDEEKEGYNNPENVYLPKNYENENNLEDLFRGIEVSFVHPCYFEQDIMHVNDEIVELENKLKGKSKRWRKKHKRKVKKIERRIRDLKEEKEKKVREWKECFLKLGVHEVPKVEYYEGRCELSCSHTYCDFQNKLGIPEEEMEYSTKGHWVGDWDISPEFEYILEKVDEERIRILLTILNKYWNEKYSKYLDMDYQWFYYSEYHKTFPSSFIRKLREKIRLPTTQNILAKPSEIFLDKPEIRELLGDNVPYLAVEIKNEEVTEALGVNTHANVRGVLNYLKALVEQGNTDKKKFEKLYEFLDEHFEEGAAIIKKEFSGDPLIFIPDAEKRYYKAREVIWKDMSNIFGKNRIYLEKQYSEIKKFFVEKLDISEKPSPKDYAGVLADISKKDGISEKNKKVVVRIYEELNHNLNPNNGNLISQEDWWEDFIQKPIFLTDKGEFRRNWGNIFINDDSELYELFKDEEDISFLHLPKEYNPDRIRRFIETCDLHYISKSTKVEPLLEESKYSKDQELTNRIRVLIPYILRYLYWREGTTYEKLKEEGTFEKIGTIEVYVADNLKVKYSINLNKWKTIERITMRKCIYHDGNLYIERNIATINDLAVEFSKVFGEVKGLDSFLLLIINTSSPSDIEKIMKIQKIGELPENAEFLRNILETGKIEEKKKPINELGGMLFNEADESNEGTPHSIVTGDAPRLLIEPTREESVIKSKCISYNTGEENWTPEFSPEEVPVRVGRYDIQKQNQITEKEEHGNYSLLSLEATTSPAEILSSRKTRENIGRWGEDYVLRCVKCELMKKYPDTAVVDTEQGFRLKRNDDVIAEVTWENKKRESGRPYDIKIIEGKREIFIEVKTTLSSTIKGVFQLSGNEWSFMKEKGDRYWIYRVYGAGSKNPEVTKIQNPIKLIQEEKIKVKKVAIEI